jgi:glycosyltransferase involved in cell wall biosynthesis
MGTYNGAGYIGPQIRSIQAQHVGEWTLLIRDDGSTDDTVEIVRRLAALDARIRLVDDDGGNLGVVQNFSRLMTIALNEGAERVFCADQDDVWQPEKLRLLGDTLRELENRYGNDTPLLVHSDLAVVNEKLELIGDSFMKYQGIVNETYAPLRVLLAQNFITGCAMAINRALLTLALPMPKSVLMHDWWLALCAAAFGMIGFVQAPTVLYRQHAANEVGAKDFWGLLNPLRTNLGERWKIGERHFFGSIIQAQHLMERIKNSHFEPNAGAVMLTEAYADCLNLNRIRRINRIRRLKIGRQGVIRQVLFLLRLVLTDRQEPLGTNSSG